MDLAAGGVYFDIKDDGDITLGIFVLRETEALAVTLAIVAPARTPVGLLCGGLDHSAGTWVVEMAQAEFYGVCLCRCSQFVHKGFDGEDIADSA